MSELVRFGISLEKTLLDKFDRYIRERNYSNRSEALRDLIRQDLIKERVERRERCCRRYYPRI